MYMAKKMNKAESEIPKQMSPEDAKAYRASLYKPQVRVLNDREKREEFRLYWTQNRKSYGRSKDIEEILWLHLKSIKMDEPGKFEDGLKHFGLKKLGN